MLEVELVRQVIREELRAVSPPQCGIPLSEYAAGWLKHRRARGCFSADDDEARLRHALPALGSIPLSEVRPKMIVELIRQLEAEKLAPRTILHVYAVLRTMFADAVREELVLGTPCVLSQRRGELPKVRDKDPNWRCTAVFDREEVELLIGERRIPLRRRVIYMLEFLAGLRINEITPRRIRDFRYCRPLCKLIVRSSYDRKHHVERPTPKNGFVREVPVHPVLRQYLHHWIEFGWEQFYGRAPTEDDLLVPGIMGGIISSTDTWKLLQDDLAMLGLSHRRQHDSRRTFITLARSDGARPDLLHWITHGPESGNIMDVYTQPPWETLCRQVAKLKINLAGSVVP